MSSIVQVFHPMFMTIFDESLIGPLIGRRASKKKYCYGKRWPPKAMSYMTLISLMRNCSVHSMHLVRMNNLQGRQESTGGGEI
jgi:hypothetical protein